MVDNPNTHQSEALVRYVAAASGLADDLGVKGQAGILADQGSRAAFLRDPAHAIVFHYTPKHASWLNQIEIWLGILTRCPPRGRPRPSGRLNQIEIWLGILTRKLLRRGSFLSVADRTAKVLAFIGYYNATMAKPCKWTYQGKALCD